MNAWQRRTAALAVALLGSAAAPALAQSPAAPTVKAPARGVSEVSVYADERGARELRKLPASALRYPIAVLDAKGDFVRVSLNGEEVWLDATDFQLERGTSVKCERVATRSTMVAGPSGASKECR
jgi:beta-lactamase class A